MPGDDGRYLDPRIRKQMAMAQMQQVQAQFNALQQAAQQEHVAAQQLLARLTAVVHKYGLPSKDHEGKRKELRISSLVQDGVPQGAGIKSMLDESTNEWVLQYLTSEQRVEEQKQLEQELAALRGVPTPTNGEQDKPRLIVPP